jgi:hypothetical protein
MSNSFRRNTSSKKTTLISRNTLRKTPILNMSSSTEFPAMSEPKENVISTSMNFMEKALVQPKDIDKPQVSQTSIQQKDDIPALILDRLVHLHEKWKEDYINDWGYSSYEQNYLFDDWDYEYFDKLDAIDEIRLEEEDRIALEKEEEECFTTDGPEYEEYLQD